jgi:glycosyltransferase involved in cell wall biosynthesis
MSTAYSGSSTFTGDPLVTIAIPTFNRASLLKNCVKAALSQTYRHFEVLVSDNASTDDTAEVLREFNDARLRVVRQPHNIGLIPNWNACLAEARGEFVVFCSDDDLLAPWILEKCVAIAAQDPKVSIVLGLCDFSGTDGSLDRAIPSRKFSTGIWQGTRLLAEYLRNKITVGNCSMMIRTEALRIRGGFPLEVPSNGADVAAWSPLLMKGSAGFVNEACATYTVNDTSESSTYSFETRLHAERQLANYIVRVASSTVEDERERRRVQLEAKCFLAGRIVFVLAQFRKRGDKLTQVLPWAWKLRHEIVYFGAANPLRLIKPIALVVVPKLVADPIRKVKEFYRQLAQSARSDAI